MRFSVKVKRQQLAVHLSKPAAPTDTVQCPLFPPGSNSSHDPLMSDSMAIPSYTEGSPEKAKLGALEAAKTVRSSVRAEGEAGPS